MTAEPTPGTRELLELIGRGLLFQAVSVAAQLGLADLLADGPRSVGDLARETGADERSVFRLLRSLEGLRLFSDEGNGRFALGPLGPALGTGPGGAGALAALMGKPFIWQAWGNLRHSVLTGEPAFRHTHGSELFDYVAADPEAGAAFHAWMTQQSQLQVPAILAAVDFSRYRRIVDVGGGEGSLLAAILAAHPEARGVLFDRPEVIARATGPAEAGVDGRCELVAGDFFERLPADGDCYLLKLVVHDWDDDRAGRIVQNVRAAIADDGRLCLAEFVIPPGDGYHHASYMDLNMMVLTEHGRERTEAEFVALLRAAGFELARVVRTGTPLSVVEAVPA